jgi:tetratricopeptide (TPR) repeat protein
MSSKISLWTGLIGIGATIALVQPNVASAKSSVEIAKTARAITVLITEPDGVGSGVILQRQGDIYTVLTAAHVVKNKGKVDYKITAPDDRKYDIISSSIRSAPGSIDLAVVKFKSITNYPTAKLGNCNVLESGMDLYVGGFPGASKAITQSVFVFREGKVSANSTKTFEKGYSLVYSNDTLPGMSGGAVLNSDGELVAIHGRGDRDDSGVKNGFNLGIPINRFATVASKMGVELGGQVAPIPQNTAPKADDYFASATQKYLKGDNRGALADLNQAIALDPKNDDAYVSRALLKQSGLRDFQGALADYNQAIALNPKNYNAYGLHGSLKGIYLKDEQGSRADNDRYNALRPKDPQGKLAEYNQIIARNPKNGGVYDSRAELKAEKLNDFQGALADYNQAIALDPKNHETYFSRGNLKYRKLNDVQGALADYTQAIAFGPNRSPAISYYVRGDLKYQKLDDVRGALADYAQAIALNPGFWDYISRGDLLYSTGNRSAALADFQKAVEIVQRHREVSIPQAIIQTQRGAYAQAIYLFNQIDKAEVEDTLIPRLGIFHKYRGEAYKRQGNRAAAIRDWRKAAQSYKKANRTRDYKIILGWLRSLGASE